MKFRLILIMIFASFMMHAEEGDNIFQQSMDQQKYVAQNDPGTGGDIGDDDPPPAPINDYLPALAIVGAALCYYAMRNKKAVTS